MSLRSLVKRSNAASMALFSVFASTTRKFFCASGAVSRATVCQSSVVTISVPVVVGTHADAREQHARHCVLSRVNCARQEDGGGAPHLQSRR